MLPNDYSDKASGKFLSLSDNSAGHTRKNSPLSESSDSGGKNFFSRSKYSDSYPENYF